MLGAQLTENVKKWTAHFFFFFLRCEPGTDAEPSLRKMWKVDRTFLFFLRCEPGTDAEPSLQKMWKVDRTFLFFCGVNLELMLSPAYKKCEKWTALFFFLRCEPGTDAEPSLQKMWKVDRTFLFFCGVNLELMLSPAYRKCGRSTALFFFFAVWTWNWCWAQLTENVKSGPQFSFFAVWTWNRCWAQLTENVKSGPQFSFFAVWTWNRCWAQLTENVKSGPHFSFLRCEPGTDAEPSLQKMWKVDRTFLFCGVNLEQMLSPAYRKCEKWTALFFFFLRCEPGTDAEPSLQKMWKVDRSFLFLRCEPGTDAEPSLEKMWKVDRTFLFFLRCEPGTDAEPSLQKMWKVDRTFLFFCGVNLEQMLSPAYRKCGRWTALFFFFAVWTWNRCWAQLTENVKSGPHFSFFLRCEPGTDAEPSLQKMWKVDRTFLFFCSVNLEQMLSPAYRKCEKWTAVFFFCGVNLEQMLSPAYRKCEKWTWNRCWPSWQKLWREREIGTADFSQSMRMRVSLAFFFALFHIFFPFFTLFSFFFTFFPFLFSHSFSHFRWPGRGRSLAALPCLPLPYLTLPLLSSPS